MPLPNYIPRWIESKLEELFRSFPAVVVSGPRQVGKSTILSEVFTEVTETVVFDPVIDVRQARADPELFVKNLRWPVVLDEIQYSPQVLAPLKRRIDREKQPGMVLLTGSQQWSVMRSLSESLAGRVLFCDLLGFGIGESETRQATWVDRYLDDPGGVLSGRSAQLNVFETLWRGFLPESIFISPQLLTSFYASYQRTYVERDVRLIAEVEDWDLFNRFVRLCAALSGQEVNYSHLGRELGINPQTSRKWLSILNATFQWFEVPAWSGNQIKKISMRPKGYFHDPGLICSLQAIGSGQALSGHPLWGGIFESAIVMDIRKQLNSLHQGVNLYHFRLHSGAEVDLILEKDGRLHPIEIKGKANLTRRDVKGIRTFGDSCGKGVVAPGLVIYLGEDCYEVAEGVWAIPWDLVV